MGDASVTELGNGYHGLGDVSVGGDNPPCTMIVGSGSTIRDETKLEGELFTAYCSVTARFLYVSQDRPDIQYAVRECSKHMS